MSSRKAGIARSAVDNLPWLERSRHGTKWIAGCVAAILALVLWRDLSYLLASPYPYGIDGYYYLAQVTSLQEQGHLMREAPPLSFWFMHGLALVLDPAVAAKICGPAFLVLSALLGLAVVHKLAKSFSAAVLGFAILLCGFMRVELLIDFLKQSLGHAWLLGILFLMAGRTRGLRKREWILVVLCLLGASLTHSGALAVGVIFVMSFLVLGFLAKMAPRVQFTLFNAGSVVGICLVTWAAGILAGKLPAGLGQVATMSFDATPRLNLGSVHDCLGPEHPAIPIALILTLLLLVSVAGSWYLGWRLERCKERDIETRSCQLAFCQTGAILMPLVALTYSPFLVPATENEMGLELRLIATLGIAAAVLVPAFLSIIPVGRPARLFLTWGLTALFVLTPPFWRGFPGPPLDNGMLHDAMVATKELIPEDAIIITDAYRGNMVNALWGRPRVIATRYDPELRGRNLYRFQMFGPEILEELDAFTKDLGEDQQPIVVLGPWLLAKEELFRNFREHLRTSDGALNKRLLSARGLVSGPGYRRVAATSISERARSYTRSPLTVTAAWTPWVFAPRMKYLASGVIPPVKLFLPFSSPSM